MKATNHAKNSIKTLVLSREDSEVFINVLLNPPEPNEALKTAAKRYQEIMGYR